MAAGPTPSWDQPLRGIDSRSILDTIKNASIFAFEDYTSVSLDLSDVSVRVGVDMLAGSYVGTYDRSIACTVNFDVIFTGLTAGTSDFSIYAGVDGGGVATETDHIVVGGAVVPEPGALLLMGSGLVGLGLGGFTRKRGQ